MFWKSRNFPTFHWLEKISNLSKNLFFETFLRKIVNIFVDKTFLVFFFTRKCVIIFPRKSFFKKKVFQGKTVGIFMQRWENIFHQKNKATIFFSRRKSHSSTFRRRTKLPFFWRKKFPKIYQNEKALRLRQSIFADLALNVFLDVVALSLIVEDDMNLLDGQAADVGTCHQTQTQHRSQFPPKA